MGVLRGGQQIKTHSELKKVERTATSQVSFNKSTTFAKICDWDIIKTNEFFSLRMIEQDWC